MKHFKRYPKHKPQPSWMKVGNKVYDRRWKTRMLITSVELRYDGTWAFTWKDLDLESSAGYTGNPILNQYNTLTHYNPHRLKSRNNKLYKLEKDL